MQVACGHDVPIDYVDYTDYGNILMILSVLQGFS
jgi:hypothetical protein